MEAIFNLKISANRVNIEVLMPNIGIKPIQIPSAKVRANLSGLLPDLR